MEIADRINQIIAHEGLSIASFARKISIGDQTVRSVCSLKRNKPGFDFISNLIQTFEWVDPVWLLTGKGSMERSDGRRTNRPDSDGIGELVQYLKEKDRKIEQLIEEKTSWRIKYEMKSKAIES